MVSTFNQVSTYGNKQIERFYSDILRFGILELRNPVTKPSY